MSLRCIGAELEDVVEVERYVGSVVAGPNKEGVGDVLRGGTGDADWDGEPALDVSY